MNLQKQTKLKPTKYGDYPECCGQLMRRGYMEDKDSAYIWHTCLLCGHEYGYTVYK